MTHPIPHSDLASRHDPYRNIHKGLRAALFDSVLRVGRMDVGDAGELQAALDQVDSLLVLMAAHVKHENGYMHPAIEARCPGGAQRTAGDHDDHLEILAALRVQVSVLRAAAPAARPALAHRLYLDLAELTAENLVHMHVEETLNNELLWALYDDSEVIAIHDTLLANVEPHILMEAIRWMAQGMSVPELAELLGDIRHKAPPPVFEATLAHVSRQLDPARMDRLLQALDMPAAAVMA